MAHGVNAKLSMSSHVGKRVSLEQQSAVKDRWSANVVYTLIGVIYVKNLSV